MDFQRIALLILRLYGGAYVAIGGAWIIAAFVLAFGGFFLGSIIGEVLTGSSSTFLTYGAMDLISGGVVIGLAPRLARFAAKL
jgi:hypothetical protein